MDNYEKIRIIQEIVNPFFKFEMDDFYGDRGGIPYPKIENLTKLFFKKNGKDRKLVITKGQEQNILKKIKQLGFGSVELIRIPSFGIYIYIDLQPPLVNHLW